jgi:DNA polymerase elongation subunit (family B)
LKFYTCSQLIGNIVYVRGWDDTKGGHFREKVSFKPSLFVATNKHTPYKTLSGTPVSPVKPGTVKECRQFIEDYQEVSGAKVYGMERFLYQYLAEEYDEHIQYDIDKIKLWSLDIETSSENGFPKPEEAIEEVLLITLKNFKSKQIITFGSKEYTPTRDDVTYVHCPNEYDLLNTFLTWWQEVEPEVITGWNVEYFDMVYLANRIPKVLGSKQENRLSPWNQTDKLYVEMYGQKREKFQIVGMVIVDYLDLYKKFTYTNQESYRLDYIAQIELGAKKLDHSEFETFKEFYTNDWKKFVDYNIVDVDLVDQLEEKMKLIDLVMLMAYDAHCNYTDTFAQVRLWDIIIYNYLRRKNIVLDIKQNSENRNDQYAGAYVKEPKPGAYDNVVSYDLNSLYPSLIRFLNVSPETLLKEKLNLDVDKLVNKEEDIFTPEDVCIAANGATYSKEECGFMPKLIKTIYEERVQYKKNMLAKKQILVDVEIEMKKRGLI